MKVSRRDMLMLLGGGAVGTIFSPIPWKLLRDSSVWTQNWPWIPVPKRGAAATAASACPLCPSACGVRVRTIGGRPVMVAGLPDAPGQRGALCAAGSGVHQLPWHPDRVRTPLRRVGGGSPGFEPASLEDAVGAIAAAIRETQGTVAILDGRPGRVLGGAYREFLSGRADACVLVPPSAVRASMPVLRKLHTRDPGPLAVDLDVVDTIVGFSAPLLDGWGQPGLVQQRMHEGRLRLFQFEAVQSRTALMADRWIPITPGTERAVALGLARMLIRSGRVSPAFGYADFKAFVAAYEPWTPRRVFEVAGVDEATLTEVADALAPTGRVVAIGGGDPAGGPLPFEDEASIQVLNLLLGAMGQAVKAQRPLADDPADAASDRVATRDLCDVPDGSVGVLIADLAMAGATVPWPILARKMAPQGLLVSLTPVLADLALHAQWVIPTAPAFTAAHDCPGHPDLPRSLRLSRGFTPAGDEVVDPVDLLNRLGTALGIERQATVADALDDLMALRLRALHRAGDGTVFVAGKDPVAMAEIDSPEDVLSMLRAGGCWRTALAAAASAEEPAVEAGDDQTETAPPRPAMPFALEQVAAKDPGGLVNGFQMYLIVGGGVERTAGVARSPILSKVDQESGLRPFANVARVNPATVASHGLRPNRRWRVSTPQGAITMRIEPDPTVPPGAILAGAEPQGALPWNAGNPVDLAAPDGKTWRLLPASITEA